jgi:hypothetical protein
LFRKLDPRLGHFEQKGLVCLIAGFSRQAQTFSRPPLMFLEFRQPKVPAARDLA